MTKLFRNVLIAVALLALTISGVWAAAASIHEAKFGGKVLFEYSAAGVDFHGKVEQGANLISEKTYVSETDTTGEGLTDWDIPTIQFLISNNTVTYTFEFSNFLTLDAENETDSVTVTITRPNISEVASLALIGGLNAVDTDAEDTAVIRGNGGKATFVYKLTLVNTTAPLAETEIEFQAVVVKTADLLLP